MIKIKVLNPTINRNEPTFRVLRACSDLLKTYSIDITDSDDYDYLFVGMNDFIDKSLSLEDSVDWGLENLNKVTEGGDFFLFDGSDSTSLMGSIEVLTQCDAIYLFKNQLLQREEYKKPSYFGRWFWGSDKTFNLGYDIKDKDWDRLELSGWNLGHLNPHLKDNISPVNSNKVHDVCAIYQGVHKKNYEHGIRNDIPYTKHRKGAWEVLDDKFDSRREKLPPEQYFAYLYNSKVVLSPFGMGEVCFRDFESITVGTIMIKPDMSMVLTEPNIYIDKETYFAVDYDWSNLNEVIDEVLSDFDRINNEVIDNVRNKFVELYNYEEYCYHLYHLFSEFKNITIGGK
ncbi:hypothetical protein HOE22_01170 [Candidatus Woesearchaeota archaeon]|jgi:hypothetical protein|nr:hypothetical protein [Candidatus Woesearchaeota archaeon]